MLRPLWHQHVRPHLLRWAERLAELPQRIESLEVGVLIAIGAMAWWFGTCPDHHTGSKLADSLFALAPRPLWVWGLRAVFWLGLVGYLEESAWMRRWSSGLQALFWWLTGAYLLRLFPVIYTPILHMLIGFLASCVWTCVAEMHIKSEFRRDEAPGPHWWLTGVRR